MASSGTYTFNLNILDIIEEAYDRLPKEARVAYDLETARRSLDLLLTEWANHQVNLWTIELDTTALVDGTSSYTISSPVIDVLDAVVVTSSRDIPMERWSMEEYLNQPNKTTEARPTHFTIVRGETDLTLYVFPTPDASYTFKYWSMNFIEDVGTTLTNNIEVPRRFVPALCAGLTYKLAQKNKARRVVSPENGRPIEIEGVSIQDRQEMKMDYETLFMQARDEDRDRASFYVVPGGYNGVR